MNTRSRFLRLVQVTAFALVAFALVNRAQAVSEKASGLFVAAFATVHDDTFAPDGSIHVNVSGAGMASLLHDATCETTNQVQTPDGVSTATYTIKGRHGTVIVQAVGHVKGFNPITRVLDFGGTFTITGGTGMYQGVTGSGEFGGSATFDQPFGGPTNQGTGNWAFWGAIQFPKG